MMTHFISFLIILDPPTYEEAAYSKDTTDKDYKFKPKYAMFKRTTSYSSEN